MSAGPAARRGMRARQGAEGAAVPAAAPAPPLPPPGPPPRAPRFVAPSERSGLWRLRHVLGLYDHRKARERAHLQRQRLQSYQDKVAKYEAYAQRFQAQLSAPKQVEATPQERARIGLQRSIVALNGEGESLKSQVKEQQALMLRKWEAAKHAGRSGNADLALMELDDYLNAEKQRFSDAQEYCAVQKTIRVQVSTLKMHTDLQRQRATAEWLETLGVSISENREQADALKESSRELGLPDDYFHLADRDDQVKRDELMRKLNTDLAQEIGDKLKGEGPALAQPAVAQAQAG